MNTLSKIWLRSFQSLLILSMAQASIAAASIPTYSDELLTTSGTAEVIQQGLEADGYALGVLAYTWGYPLVRMERITREYTEISKKQSATSYRAPLNTIGWAKELASPDAKDMPTANNDTLYMSSVVNLDQPYILTVPEMDDRYYVVDVFNMWHELEHYIGRRTTGTKAGRYVIVPPNWQGELPLDAMRIDVTTDKVWLWGRMRVLASESVSKLHKLQDGFTLTPLSAKKSAGILAELPQIGNNPLGFLHHLAFALARNPVKQEEIALFKQLERIKVTKGHFAEDQLSPAMRRGLIKGLKAGPSVATASFASSSLISKKQGWDFAVGLDDFGYNYPFRTMISGPYLGGQGEKEAIYPFRLTDDKGEPLSGKNSYVIKFEQEPPVDAFWSLTIYNAQDKMLVRNPINRFKIGGDTPNFTKNSNGSFEIPIQTKKPTGEFAENWLPAPEGNFYLLLRLYQPDGIVLTKKYEFPKMTKVKN